MSCFAAIPSSLPPKSMARFHRSFIPPLFNSANCSRVRMTSVSTSDDSQLSSSIPLIPARNVVVSCGSVSVDFLATVKQFPNPDDKIRSINSKVEGGGNAGNALTCIARLGLRPRIVTKVANDGQGKSILQELESDGVDTSYIVASYLGIPILVGAERKRGLDDLLNLAEYVVCSAKFFQIHKIFGRSRVRKVSLVDNLLQWRNLINGLLTEPLIGQGLLQSQFPTALVSMLLKLPQAKFVIVTIGESGCAMLERSLEDGPDIRPVDVHELFESLNQNIDLSNLIPRIYSSEHIRNLSAQGIGAVNGRLILCTAESIPSSEVIDTTGAGDAFIGAVIYGLYVDDVEPLDMIVDALPEKPILDDHFFNALEHDFDDTDIN